MNGLSPREKVLVWLAVVLAGLAMVAGIVGTIQDVERRDQQFHSGVRR